MKLSAFSIKNYRSITTTRKISTGELTVLIGKNNEGKTNIINALSIAMRCMQIYIKYPNAKYFSRRVTSEDERLGLVGS